MDNSKGGIMGIFTKYKLKKEIQNKASLTDMLKEKFLKNRWSVFAFVSFAAISTVIYVSNVRNINNIAEMVDKKSRMLDELRNSNEVLNHKLVKLQSPSRIIAIATMKLGMVKPDKAPIVIEENE